MSVFLGLGPGCGCHVFDLLVGPCWQLGEDFAQVGLRVDSSTAAGFDDRKEDGAALFGFGLADEQPVFLADGSWPDGVFDGVVVDLDSAVFDLDSTVLCRRRRSSLFKILRLLLAVLPHTAPIPSTSLGS